MYGVIDREHNRERTFETALPHGILVLSVINANSQGIVEFLRHPFWCPEHACVRACVRVRQRALHESAGHSVCICAHAHICGHMNE
jgi:hypothetical protein